MDPAQAYLDEVCSRFAKTRSKGVNSPVRQQLEDSTVLVTGGAGFIGKHLLEKLLRSCNIKKAYLILRTKKGQTVEERLQSIFKDPLFDFLNGAGNLLSRVAAVEGDMQLLRLGLKDDDWMTISEEVQYIFHVAATVNFNAHIKVATLTNVRGTRELVALARQCKQLRAFVHVSTAYSHATKEKFHKKVFEQFYPSPVPPALMINMAETLDEKVLEEITPKLLSTWPNTYTYTKAIAEDVIKEAEDLPVCVVRPAIVLNVYKDPLPGWLDPSCVYGPSGIVLGAGIGLLHVLYVSRPIRIDMVPVDYVTNTIIAAAWSSAQTRQAKIYAVVTARKPVKWGDRLDVLNNCGIGKLITPKAIWYCKIHDTNNLQVYHIYNWLLHFIPAYFIDAVLWLIGKPVMANKMFTKVSKLQEALSYFTTHTWDFKDDNTSDLYNSLSLDDKDTFDCDTANIKWEDHVKLWVLGVRKYLLKDGLADTNYAIRKQFYFKFLHYFVLAIYFYVLWKVASVTFGIFFSFL